MKIGVFGGTFDPVHYGHLILAEWIINVLQLDRFIFIPANVPPHKQDDDVTPSQLRLEMLRFAIQNNPSLEVSDIEIKREGVSYSIDTILELRRKLNLTSQELFTIIGADSILDFHKWHRPMDILNSSQVVVYKRMDYDLSNLRKDYSERILVVDNPIIEISSTLVRELIRKDYSIKYLVPPSVETYIHINELYKKNVDFGC